MCLDISFKVQFPLNIHLHILTLFSNTSLILTFSLLNILTAFTPKSVALVVFRWFLSFWLVHRRIQVSQTENEPSWDFVGLLDASRENKLKQRKQ